VQDRLGHDHRYAIDPSKISCELGWTPTTRFEDGIVTRCVGHGVTGCEVMLSNFFSKYSCLLKNNAYHCTRNSAYDINKYN
jgi:hypothetical protein